MNSFTITNATTTFILLLGAVLPWVALGLGVYFRRKVPISDGKIHYAGFWLRAAARIVDQIVLFGAFQTLGYSLIIIAYSQFGDGVFEYFDKSHAALAFVLYLFGIWLYFAAMEGSRYEATIGKMIFGLRVVDLNGGRIGFRKAAGRQFCGIFSILTLGIGYCMAGWTKKKQALHDNMADCLVVRSSKSFNS